jgi:anti-anti-sigma factor
METTMVSSEQSTKAYVVVREHTAERFVAVLFGSLDLAIAADLGQQLRAVVVRDGVRVLALDLAAVDFCDCAVLRELVRTHSEGRKRGRSVVITAASPVVSWLLRLVNLDQLFGCSPYGSGPGTADPSHP